MIECNRSTCCPKLLIMSSTMSAKSIRAEKIFLKKTLFLKSKYYLEMNHRIDIESI